MKKAIILLLAVAVLLPAALSARQKMRIVRKGPGGSVTREFTEEMLLSVPELSAMIMEQEGGIVVDHIVEKEMRMKGYETTDLQEGDKVLMANGKKIANLKELRGLYEKAAAGETVKLGVKRGEEMVIATFVKADEKLLPKRRMMFTTGGDKEILGIPQVGLVLTAKGDDVVVERVLENAAEAFSGKEIKEGDVITTLNTFPVKSFSDFQKRYESIPVGDKVELIAKRAGGTETLTFAKPKGEGKVIIRR